MYLKKVSFLLNQFVFKMLCHTCDIKIYYIALQCSKMINDISSWNKIILHFELTKCCQIFIFMKLKIRSANLQIDSKSAILI